MKSNLGFKGLALGVILINVVVALWGWSVQPDSRRPSEASGTSLNRIILLGELTTDEQSRLVLSLQTEQARNRALQNFREIEVQDEPLPSAGCYIYSFATSERLSAFFERIKTLVANAYIGAQVSQSPGAVMLYIEPLPSFRLAQIELNELRAAGVDGFIIPDGGLANGISVGVFNSEQNIEQRTSQLERLGYPVERYQYMVDRSVYAVNVPALSQAQIDTQAWIEIQQDFSQLSSQQNSCWEVASTLNFN